MAVPTRTEALSLLLSTRPSERLVQHVTVVAEVASFLAHRAQRAGLGVDRRLVETAALLHDIDKALPADDPLRELGHGHAGAAWLSAAGHAELARPVAAHPVMRLDAPDADEWLATAPLEDRIVCYADKRATQRVVSLEQRFERWRGKHPDYADHLAVALMRARRLGVGALRAPSASRRMRRAPALGRRRPRAAAASSPAPGVGVPGGPAVR